MATRFDDWDGNFLSHHGIKGQKWGVKHGPPYPLNKEQSALMQTNGDEDLVKKMGSFRYKNFTRLMSPEEVEKSRSGSCHDQVVYAYKELQKLGLNPKAEFVMETDAKGNGGMTHSFIYYEKNGKIIWFENAWKERAGLSEYDSLSTIKKEINAAHLSGEFGDRDRYKDLDFAPFDVPKHNTGESLQQLVDICFGGKIEHMDKVYEFRQHYGTRGMKQGRSRTATRFDDWEGDFLEHYGTRGMKWGVRRFQNPDGTLTALGRERYGDEGHRSMIGRTRDLRKLAREAGTSTHYAKTLTKQYTLEGLAARKQRALAKGKTDKAERLQRRADKINQSISDKKRAKAEKYAENAKRATSMLNEIIANSKKQGYKVTAKERTVYYQTGKQKVATILSAISAAGAARAIAPYSPIAIGGNRYAFAPYVMPGRAATEKKYTVRRR